jgi:glucosamine--fructose-6-phosphate aminotransferase (isomerizing)
MEKKMPSVMELLEKAKDRKQHPFLMYENIINTPSLMRECLKDSCYESVQRLAELIVKRKIKKIFFGGCGTSLFAGEVIGRAFDSLLKIPFSAEDPFETLIYPPSDLDKESAFLIITHSGNTLVDRQAAQLAKKRGALVIAFTDNPDAAIIPLVDHVVVGPGGRDTAIPKTRSYVTALFRGFMLVSMISDRRFDTDLMTEVKKLPEISEKAINENETKIKKLVKKWGARNRYLSAGIGPNAWTALEAALKMMETNGMPSFGFEMEEYCHGPELSLNEGSGVFLYQSGVIGLERTVSAAKATIATGAKLMVITNQPNAEWPKKADILEVPKTHDLFSPIPFILPSQLLVYYTALHLNRIPDIAGTDNPKIKDVIKILHPPGTH